MRDSDQPDMLSTAPSAVPSVHFGQIAVLLRPQFDVLSSLKARIGTLSRCSVTLPHTGGSISHQLVFTRVLSTKFFSSA